MSAEVARLAKQLEKLQKDDFEDPERALDLLKQLKECNINIEVLNTTRVGLIVNTLRKKTNSMEVASLGKKLIKTWKKFLPPDEPKRPKSAHRPISPLPDMEAMPKEGQDVETLDETPASSYQSEPPRSSYPPPTRRQFQPILTGDGVRDKIVEMIVDALKKNLPQELIYESKFYKLASEIEEISIFFEFHDTGMKYKNRCRSRISNLKDTKNPILRQRVLSREIEPEVFAKMNAEEMASEQLKKKLEEYMESNINSAKMGTGTGTKTDLFKCWKCKGGACSYFQLQTRSADEPMTTYVWCNDCGNRWKFC